MALPGRGGGPLAGAGPVGGGGRVGGAELDGGGVLQRVLARLHLHGDLPNPHQAPPLAPLRPAGGLSPRPPAGSAAGHEEGHGHQQEEGADDDGGVARGHEGAEGKGAHQGDVDPGQQDAETAGAAQGRGRQVLVPQEPLLLGGLLGGGRRGGLLGFHGESCAEMILLGSNDCGERIRRR